MKTLALLSILIVAVAADDAPPVVENATALLEKMPDEARLEKGKKGVLTKVSNTTNRFSKPQERWLTDLWDERATRFLKKTAVGRQFKMKLLLGARSQLLTGEDVLAFSGPSDDFIKRSAKNSVMILVSDEYSDEADELADKLLDKDGKKRVVSAVVEGVIKLVDFTYEGADGYRLRIVLDKGKIDGKPFTKE